jgi:hypothetical protein
LKLILNRSIINKQPSSTVKDVFMPRFRINRTIVLVGDMLKAPWNPGVPNPLADRIRVMLDWATGYGYPRAALPAASHNLLTAERIRDLEDPNANVALTAEELAAFTGMFPVPPILLDAAWVGQPSPFGTRLLSRAFARQAASWSESMREGAMLIALMVGYRMNRKQVAAAFGVSEADLVAAMMGTDPFACDAMHQILADRTGVSVGWLSCSETEGQDADDVGAALTELHQCLLAAQGADGDGDTKLALVWMAAIAKLQSNPVVTLRDTDADAHFPEPLKRAVQDLDARFKAGDDLAQGSVLALCRAAGLDYATTFGAGFGAGRPATPRTAKRGRPKGKTRKVNFTPENEARAKAEAERAAEAMGLDPGDRFQARRKLVAVVDAVAMALGVTDEGLFAAMGGDGGAYRAFKRAKGARQPRSATLDVLWKIVLKVGLNGEKLFPSVRPPRTGSSAAAPRSRGGASDPGTGSGTIQALVTLVAERPFFVGPDDEVVTMAVPAKLVTVMGSLHMLGVIQVRDLAGEALLRIAGKGLMPKGAYPPASDAGDSVVVPMPVPKAAVRAMDAFGWMFWSDPVDLGRELEAVVARVAEAATFAGKGVLEVLGKERRK